MPRVATERRHQFKWCKYYVQCRRGWTMGGGGEAKYYLIQNLSWSHDKLISRELITWDWSSRSWSSENWSRESTPKRKYFNWWKFPDVQHEEWMVLVRWFSTHIVHNIHVGMRLHQYLDHLRVAMDGCQAKRCVAILYGEKYESNKYRIHYEVQASTWLHTEGHMQARGCVNPVGHSAPHHCVQRPAMQSLCRFQL
jgi:hypothetical protein